MRIFSSPPFLCVEILSPEDSALELRIKIDEFLTFGVPYIWVIDPTSRTGEIYTPDRIEKVANGQFTADTIRVDLNRFDQNKCRYVKVQIATIVLKYT